DFPTADYLTGIGQKVFIAELMPKYPIYVSLLSKEAQAVIGKVHEKTRPALLCVCPELTTPETGGHGCQFRHPTLLKRTKQIKTCSYICFDLILQS
ncbi:MAG: arginine N-succinyltransferase, partial [Spirosomataceae bacterium]